MRSMRSLTLGGCLLGDESQGWHPRSGLRVIDQSERGGESSAPRLVMFWKLFRGAVPRFSFGFLRLQEGFLPERT